MLPRIDPNSVGPVSPVQAPLPAESVGDARQDAFQRSLQAMQGKSMQGQVLSRLTDGSFLVRVAGSAARMMLPPGTLVGADLALTLLTMDPRPTFQVGAGSGPDATATLAYAPDAPGAKAAERANSLAAALLGKAPLTPASLLPDFDASAPPPELSNAARAIATVLMQAEGTPGVPLAVAGKTPLLAPPVLNVEQLARTLHDAVGKSGLFYESHVAEWAEGKRTLPELMREPQMQKMAQGFDGAAKAPGVDLAAAQLINLQLHTHEQSRVAWQGEAWPGQKMEWEINKDAPEGGQDDGADGEPGPAAWRSGVRFQFPMLGAVTASVVLVDGQVRIQMQTGSQESAAALRLHAAELERSMAAAGSPLASLTICRQEAATDV